LRLKWRYTRFGLCKLQTSFGWRNWGRGISNTQIIFKACLEVEEIGDEFARGYASERGDEFWGTPVEEGQIAKLAESHDQINN